MSMVENIVAVIVLVVMIISIMYIMKKYFEFLADNPGVIDDER